MIECNKPLCIDAFDLLAQLDDESVDLVFVDPPYNIGIFSKMEAGEYLDWCKRWVVEADRVLAHNGAFWVSHKDPEVLVEISRMIAECGRGRINWVTWDKYNGAEKLKGFLDGYTVTGSLRSFQVMAEYLIYHADDGAWTAKCDKERGFIFEPLRAYLDKEKCKAGFTTRQVAESFQRKTGSKTVTGMAGHWFSNVQWVLPTEENYQWLRNLFNRECDNKYLQKEYKYLQKEYKDLQKEYKDLRQEYEHLRYTFNNPGKVSSVWQIPPASKNGHPTPKPTALLKRIIETTSNPGDVVLDFFAGSFTTAVVAEELGRKWICGDGEERWVKLGKSRLAQPRLFNPGGLQ